MPGHVWRSSRRRRTLQPEVLLNCAAGRAYDDCMEVRPVGRVAWCAGAGAGDDAGVTMPVPVPIGGAGLPLGGIPRWPAASHCIVVNKCRFPQIFRIYLAFS